MLMGRRNSCVSSLVGMNHLICSSSNILHNCKVGMWFIMINDSFLCKNCRKEVTKHPSWSARNHCPFCLYSKHLDKDYPWDRISACHGLMKPVWKEYRKNKGWMIIHECITCNKKILNKIAEDDSIEIFSKLWNNIS